MTTTTTAVVAAVAAAAIVVNVMDGDVAQLVDHRTGRPRTQVRFPDTARDFFSQPSVQILLRCPYNPRVQSHSLTFVRTLTIL